MARCCEKNFFERKICFMCSLISFLSTPAYFSCNIKLFVSTQNYFSCNTKVLFWTLFKMLCHVDIFLLSRSNKNIATYQKKYFYVTQNISFLFCVSQILCSIFILYIGNILIFFVLILGTKKLLNHLLLCLIYGSSY